jgi:hypothetical protein
MRFTFKLFKNISRDPAKDVADLNELVAKATTVCTIEYFQLITMPLVKPASSPQDPKSTLNDLVIFNIVSEDLLSERFRDHHVWQGWRYIRELVIKYITEDNDKVKSLDDGMVESLRFKLLSTFWKSRIREFEKKRPKVDITKAEWEKVPPESLNNLLNQAYSEVCGDKGRKRWLYEDLFGEDVLDRQDLFPKSAKL